MTTLNADKYYSKEARRALCGSKGKRGGARPGAGRKPTGPKTVNTMFCLSLETFAELGKIPRGARSKFVDAAIREKLAAKL